MAGGWRSGRRAAAWRQLRLPPSRRHGVACTTDIVVAPACLAWVDDRPPFATMALPWPAELTGAVGGPTTQQLPQRPSDAAQVGWHCPRGLPSSSCMLACMHGSGPATSLTDSGLSVSQPNHCSVSFASALQAGRKEAAGRAAACPPAEPCPACPQAPACPPAQKCPVCPPQQRCPACDCSKAAAAAAEAALEEEGEAAEVVAAAAAGNAGPTASGKAPSAPTAAKGAAAVAAAAAAAGAGLSDEWVQRLRVPWGPLLTQEEAQRGLAYYGSGQRLQAVVKKLMDGKPIKVGSCGCWVVPAGALHFQRRWAAALAARACAI